MSRKLVLVAICLMMLLSSLMVRADIVADSPNEPAAETIVSNDAALKTLREETQDALTGLLNTGLSPRERVERLEELTLKANNRMDEMTKTKQVNPMDALNVKSEYWRTFKVISGAVALYSMDADSKGFIGAKACSQTKGVLMGSYLLEPPPFNKPSELDLLLESVRKLLCPNVR